MKRRSTTTLSNRSSRSSPTKGRRDRVKGKPAGLRGPLSSELLQRMNAYWRAANYLSVGQIYLYDNPLLKRPLTLGDVKHMLLGHWGTTPGQNFIYVHLNRVIKKYDLDMIYVSGPGMAARLLWATLTLRALTAKSIPNISQDEAGLRKLFLQFSFPGGIPSHASPETPGSLHEDGELGIRLAIRSGRFRSSRADRRLRRPRRRGGTGRWPRLGTRTSSSIRLRTAKCRRPASQRLQISNPRSWPALPTRNWSSCSAATAGRRISWRGEAEPPPNDTTGRTVRHIQPTATPTAAPHTPTPILLSFTPN